MIRVCMLPPDSGRHDGVSRYRREMGRLLAGRVEFADNNDCDVIHLVGAHCYDPVWRRAKASGKKLVVTVHDLIPEIFGLRGPIYAGVSERAEVLAAADRIVAVSRKTRDDLVSRYGIEPARVDVIHNGIDKADAHITDRTACDSGNFILWVGRRAGYKNFFWFVHAVAPLLWSRGLRVVCTGGQPFGRKERLWMALHGVRGRFLLVDPDDAALCDLYAHAYCLVMPSRYEGFGLPVVEAMAEGCPVVLPHDHVFPEIAGGAASWYEANNAPAFRRAVRQVGEGAFRQELIRRGRVRAADFSWRKSADELLRIYREVTGLQ